MTTTNEPTRTRPSPSPASSSTVAIVLAVIAAVVGFFIIKQVRDDGNGGGGSPPASSTQGTGSTIDTGSLPTVTGGAPPTSVFVTTGTSVQVVNVPRNGVAGRHDGARGPEVHDGRGRERVDQERHHARLLRPANRRLPVADWSPR
jgi:hypothetical protein